MGADRARGRVGGAVEAVEVGFVQSEIEESAFGWQQDVEAGERAIVGVNRYVEHEAEQIELHRVDSSPNAGRSSGQRAYAPNGTPTTPRGRSRRVREAARGDENMLLPMRDALRARCTVGEICGVLRDEWGRTTASARRRDRPAEGSPMSGALEYHRATNVAAHGTDEDEARRPETRPLPFNDYGEAQRLPLETSVAGPLLQAGAGIVRSQPRRDYGGGTIHWRAYSSAGALFPVEAYVAAADGLYSFDALTPALVQFATATRAQRSLRPRTPRPRRSSS